MLRLMAPRTLGLAAAQINLIVLTFFGSMVGDSSISALNFAWLLLMFPVGLFGMSLATAVFPSLAERAALAGPTAVNTMVSQTSAIHPLPRHPRLDRDAAPPRLDRLHPARTRRIRRRRQPSSSADALLFYSIGIFAHAAIEIVSRGFYVLGDTRTPVALAIASMLLNILLSAVLVGPMELKGLALALSISAIAEFALAHPACSTADSIANCSPAARSGGRRPEDDRRHRDHGTTRLAADRAALIGLDIDRDSWITLAARRQPAARVVYFMLSLLLQTGRGREL